jgi:hypothetical protein
MARGRYLKSDGTSGAPSRTRGQASDQGEAIVYLARRILPLPETVMSASVYVVQAGDRIDLVAARLLGDPLLYWQIADANGATDPTTLCATAGRRLRIPAPLGQSQTVLDQPKATGSTAAPATADHSDDDEAED